MFSGNSDTGRSPTKSELLRGKGRVLQAGRVVRNVARRVGGNKRAKK